MTIEAQIEYLRENLKNPTPPACSMHPTKDGKFYTILCFDLEEFEPNIVVQRRLDHLCLHIASAGYKLDKVDHGSGTLVVHDANKGRVDMDNRRMNKAVFYFTKDP